MLQHADWSGPRSRQLALNVNFSERDVRGSDPKRERRKATGLLRAGEVRIAYQDTT